jgi:hypothetical protein
MSDETGANPTPTPAPSDPETTPAPTEVQPTATPSADSSLSRDFAFTLPLFASDSAWNQTADQANVLPDSDQQILVTYRVLRGDTTTLSPEGPPSTTWPFMDISYDEFSIPVFLAGSEETSVPLCNYSGELDWTNPKVLPDTWQTPGGPVIIPTPARQIRPAGPLGNESDGHLVLYNPDTTVEYDFWQATTVRDGECQSRGGGLSGASILEAGMVDFFDVHGAGANPAGNEYASARASGVPLLAGLILPEDVESGAISHALACGIPNPRNINRDSPVEGVDYFHPASRPEETFFNSDPNAVAQGQRIRLKPTLVDEEGAAIDETELAPITRMFLAALRTYGAYVLDNAGGFSFSAEDIHSAVLRLSDDEVNTLIGQPVGTSLPSDKSKWQTVLDKLSDEDQLGRIPFAFGPWTDGQDPATAAIVTANFEVVDPAIPPT